MPAFYEDNSISHDITTDAGFRAWAQKIHDGLATGGAGYLVQTSDTGQINLTTVTTPASNNTTAGYEIWRFDDAAQSGDPIYFKLEYGRGSGATFNRLICTVGRGSNGTGTLTTACTARTFSQGAAVSGNGRVIVSWFDGALFILSVATVTSGSAGYWLVIERLRDTDGALVSGQAAFLPYNQAGSIFSGGAWNNSPVIYALGSSVAVGGKILLGSWRIGSSVVCGPLRGVAFAISGAIGADDTGDLTFSGTAIEYKRVNMTQTYGPFDWAGSGQACNVLCQHET